MDTRISAIDRRRARGAATPVIIAVVLILIALGVAAWFLIIKPNREAVQPAATPTAAGQKAAAAKATPPPADVASMSTEQLLSEARKAMNEQRLLAPAGNNAFEFYLKVLERQPGNQVAQDALRETFPFGANAAEQSINQRDFAEAQREIDLLAKADPDNYTLTILRSKLDAQRKTLDREQQQAEQQQLAQQQAAQQAARQAEADKLAQQQAAAEAARKQQEADAARSQAAAQQQASTPSQAPAQQPQQATIQNAVLIKQVRPRYPTVAMRERREGWVVVEYTIDTEGNVGKVRVVDAQPRHVFDRAAEDAVERWKFRPALRNGQPMPVTKRQRITFTLGQN